MTSSPDPVVPRTVGVVGLGMQGAPIARRIAAAGWPLSVWARRPGTQAAMAATPHEVCDSVAGLAARSDLVAICVRHDDDLREILVGRGLLAGLAPGAIVVNHGTGSPATSQQLARQARDHGVFFLDAPVSGGAAAAARGALTAMVGGELLAFERARPVLASCASTIAYFGEAGSGQRVKLLNNAVHLANIETARWAVGLAREAGLALSAVVAAWQAGSGASYALRTLMADREAEDLAHVANIMRKDADQVMEAFGGDGGDGAALAASAGAGAQRFAAAAQEGGWRPSDATVRRSIRQVP